MKRLRLNVCYFCLSLTAVPFLSSPAQAAFFNYLYVEASEGNSSGGHTAIQFGNDVYHYQHLDSGLIRLFRRDRDDFHFLYRYLQNRPIHESRIGVSDESFQLFQDHFKWQLLTQERLFKLLDDLNRDRIFIRYLLQQSDGDETAGNVDASSVIRLKGVGLFFPDQGSEHQQHDTALIRQHSHGVKQLRQKLEQRYGQDFLRHRRDSIESQIKALPPSRWPVLNPQSKSNKLPPPVYSLTEKYLDSLTALFAIKAIAEERPLQSDAYFQMIQPEFKLTEAERKALLNFRERLETSFLKSIDSERPDWGYAALVNMARYLAVDSTIQSGYWVFIDDFSENSEWVSPGDYLQHSGHVQTLLNDARATLERNRQLAVRGDQFSESAYSSLEMSANRYAELLKSQKVVDFRYKGEKAVPSKSIGITDAIVPNLTREQLTAALAELDQFENRLFQQLTQDYRYDLISRNCVTELFRSINQALSQSLSTEVQQPDRNENVIKESKKRLGGYVSIPYNFIPFVSYQSVLANYHVTASRDLNSFRGQELAKLKARQNPLTTALSESNIVSSSLYQYNQDDALFVFFTDGNVVLRPLFGVFNTAAGLGQSIYGAFSWPFDSGKNLKSGAKGILMSLPELLFFNMRKGSYKYLSFSRLANEGGFNP